MTPEELVVKELRDFSNANRGCEGFAVGAEVYEKYYRWLTESEYGPRARADRVNHYHLCSRLEYTKFKEIGFEEYEFFHGKPLVEDISLDPSAIETRAWPDQVAM